MAACAYNKQATDFLEKHGISFSTRHCGYNKYFHDDIVERHVFRVTLRRGRRSMSVKFGQSIAAQSIAAGPSEPRVYDVLACLTKSDPGTFKEFCADYGYNTDSINALSVYRHVRNEWKKVFAFFTAQEIEELAEIQ